MRIAIDYTSAIRQRAGIGRYTRELTKALLALDQQNRYLLFSAGRSADEPRWPSNVRRRSVPLSDHHLALIWQRLRLPIPAELLTGPVDLFHSPDFVLPPLLKAASVVTIHDLSFMRLPHCSPPPLLEYLMRSVPRSAQRTDAILADSESTRRDVIELLGIDAERVHVVNSAKYEVADKNPEGEAWARDLLERAGLDPGRPILLGGSTWPGEEDAMLGAYVSLRDRVPGPHCSNKTAIVGHTSQKDGEVLDLGYLKCIDTCVYGDGRLTAMNVESGRLWQADKHGRMKG